MKNLLYLLLQKIGLPSGQSRRVWAALQLGVSSSPNLPGKVISEQRNNGFADPAKLEKVNLLCENESEVRSTFQILTWLFVSNTEAFNKSPFRIVNTSKGLLKLGEGNLFNQVNRKIKHKALHERAKWLALTSTSLDITNAQLPSWNNLGIRSPDGASSISTNTNEHTFNFHSFNAYMLKNQKAAIRWGSCQEESGG